MAEVTLSAAPTGDGQERPSRLMRNPRTWLAIVQIMLHKLCCWWTLAKPVEWRTARVACLGLDGAGKTSVASCVEGVKPSVQHEPTSGFNCRNARVAPHWQLDLWDLGGSALIRQYWSRYLTADTKILLFVVDAADRARFAEARAALDGALAATDELPALLVLANKQDLPGAATTAEVSDALGIAAGASATRAAVLPISCARAAAAGADAQSASGLSDVLAWVSSALQSISHVDDE